MILRPLRPEFFFCLAPGAGHFPYTPGTVCQFSVEGITPEGKHESAACSELLGVLHKARHLQLDTVQVDYYLADEMGEFPPRGQGKHTFRLLDAFTSRQELVDALDEIYRTIHLGTAPALLTLPHGNI